MNLQPDVALHVLAGGAIAAEVAYSLGDRLLADGQPYARVGLFGDNLVLLTKFRLLVAQWATGQHLYVRAEQPLIGTGELPTWIEMQTFVEGDERFDPPAISTALATLLREHGLAPVELDGDGDGPSRLEMQERTRLAWERAERSGGGR